MKQAAGGRTQRRNSLECGTKDALAHRCPFQSLIAHPGSACYIRMQAENAMNEPFPPSLPKSDDKLSLTSMILGILSLVLCSIFTGIPAVITGHIARGRTKRDPQAYGGAGMAMAGLVMGYVSIGMLLVVLPLAAALVLPAFAKAKYKAQQVSCMSNLRQVTSGAIMYAQEHEQKWPGDFLSMSNELTTPNILTCPGDNSKTRVNNWEDVTPATISYEFLAPNLDPSKTPEPVPAFRCSIHNNVGMSDGSVQSGSSSPRRR